MERKIIKVISVGGLGDVLLCTPSFKALKEKHPHSKIIVYARKKDRDVFDNNPFIDKLAGTFFLPDPERYFRRDPSKRNKFIVPLYGSLMPSLYYRKNATEIIAEYFDVELKDKNVQVYLTEKEDEKAVKELKKYKTPVIMHITSIFSRNQMWPLSNWVDLVRQMPDCTFLQVGSSEEDKVEGAIDLRGKTTFREGLALLKHSASFVGVVSSFSHATNAFNIPGVVLFGPSTPLIWGHDNNINLFRDMRCSPCVDVLANAVCPYGKICVDSITVEEVRTGLTRQLQKRTK